MFLNVKRTPGFVPLTGAVGIAMTGEVKLLSPGVAEPAPNAVFGAESTVVVVVTQRTGVAPVPLRAVVQLAGSAGAVMPSKFSVNAGAELMSSPSVNGMLTLPRSRSPS